jgi:signal transduction histidine kinase
MKTTDRSEQADWGSSNGQQLLEALLEKERLGYMGFFTQGLIHNINGPLQNISMLTEFVIKGHEQIHDFVRESCGSENLRSWDNLSSKQAQRFKQLGGQISALVEMLRDFMWLHEVERNESDMDLNLLIRKLIPVFRADLFFKHNVELELQLGNRLPLVEIVGRHLIPALIQLFSNAMTALRTAPRKKLIIETRLEGKNALIIFRDSGGGFKPEESQKLFEPFISDWSSEPSAGSVLQERHFGLGLSMVTSLLKPYGVTVSLKRIEDETHAILEIPSA